MNEWREIGMLIGGVVAKQPPYIQIGIVLAAAFTTLMILEGLRASFGRRGTPEPGIRVRPETAVAFRSAPGNAAKLRYSPRRYENIVKPHRALKPVIRRNLVKAPKKSSPQNLPQVGSFDD